MEIVVVLCKLPFSNREFDCESMKKETTKAKQKIKKRNFPFLIAYLLIIFHYDLFTLIYYDLSILIYYNKLLLVYLATEKESGRVLALKKIKKQILVDRKKGLKLKQRGRATKRERVCVYF